MRPDGAAGSRFESPQIVGGRSVGVSRKSALLASQNVRTCISMASNRVRLGCIDAFFRLHSSSSGSGSVSPRTGEVRSSNLLWSTKPQFKEHVFGRSLGGVDGYGVIEKIRARSSEIFDLPEGSVYPALHRLERQGFLRSQWEQGARRRRTYRLTRRGRAELARQRQEWKSFSRAVRSVAEPAS